MNIVICDDSQADRSTLANLLRDYKKGSGEKFDIKEYDRRTTLCKDAKVLQDCQIV